MNNHYKETIKGTMLCLTIDLPSWLLVRAFPGLELIGAPVLAILAGMVLGTMIKDKSPYRGGITFVSKKILQYAVVLLGFGLNLATVKQVGMTSLPIIISTITISLLVALVLRKKLCIPVKIATLIGVGSSICGGSAIAATAPVIDADDGEIAQAISVIFLFNILAALLFPAFGEALGLSNDGFGLFAGTAVNDTSSVTAAASTWDTIHGTGGSVLEYATIVKLTRTLAIIPITLVLAYLRIRQNSDAQVSLKSVFPTFVLYFILASVITTVITTYVTGAALDTANQVFGTLKQISKFFIVMAMGAIGFNSNLVKLVKTGGKSILLGFTCWAAITAVSLVLQQSLGIW